MAVNVFGPPFDWAATGAMVQGLATLVGAAAVLVAAKMGADTFGAWRRQNVAGRKIDQAERILTATYNARRGLRYVRRPMILAYELTAAETKLKAEGEAYDSQPEARQKRLVTAQAYFDRINGTREDREELSKCLPMARALFGPELEGAIEQLDQQYWIIQVDAESYIDDDGSDPDFTKKTRRGMYDIKPPNNEVNEVTAAIDEAVKIIEDTCLPTLRLDQTPNKPAPPQIRN